MKSPLLALLACLWLVAPMGHAQEVDVRIASKTFIESYVLGEIAAQLLASEGFTVEHEQGLGGTLVAHEALKAGSIDLYPDYTGTLAQVILGRPGLDGEALADALAERGLQMRARLGFNNSYAMGVSGPIARELGLEKVSDLAAHPELRAAFTHEFLNREDGWPALSAAYGLTHQPAGIEHALAYVAIESGQLDFTDAYTTDGELSTRDIVLLEDNLKFFPQYDTVLLTRTDLPEDVAAVLAKLEGILDEPTMQRLNFAVAEGTETPTSVAAKFLREKGLVEGPAPVEATRAERILDNTITHLKLTGIALLLACLVAIPLALVLARFERAARTLLYITGLVQTIPALALLALLIPIMGLGQTPAIFALFLYSLLPIVRNTLTGLFNVDPLLKEVATGMGLTERQQLWHVELPLAVPTLLAGVKTAAIVSIGTATLAAFVGAGGLGEPIITGLNLNDHRLILEGALPAAALAIVVELLFEWVERALIPAHLRSQ